MISLMRIAAVGKHLVHRLHWVAIALALKSLFWVEVARTPDGHLAFTPRWVGHFSLEHHGLYFLIIAVMLACELAVRVHTLRHENTRLPLRLIDRPPAEMRPLISGKTFAAGDAILKLEQVTDGTFDEFISLMDRAYPSVRVTPMSRRHREKFYRAWLKEPAKTFMAFVVRTPTDGTPSTRIGLVAAAQIRHKRFRRLIRCETEGIECSAGDLGNDTDATTFVEVKHLYIRRGRAPATAMLWVLRSALQSLVQRGSAPVIYGTTVTEIGIENYRTLGFSNVGETPVSCKLNFVLDARRNTWEQLRPAAWTLRLLCDVIEQKGVDGQPRFISAPLPPKQTAIVQLKPEPPAPQNRQSIVNLSTLDSQNSGEVDLFGPGSSWPLT